MEEYCITTAGNPDPTEMWTNVTSGEHIEGNLLNITNINRAQAGDYKCTANNTCGDVSTLMNINVQCKNAIRFFYNVHVFLMLFTKCVHQVVVSWGCS